MDSALQTRRDNSNVRYIFYLQHICPVCWTSVSTDDWYSNGYKMCSATP